MLLLISLQSRYPIEIYWRRCDAERELAEILHDEPDWEGSLEIIEWETPVERDDTLTNPVRWN